MIDLVQQEDRCVITVTPDFGPRVELDVVTVWTGRGTRWIVARPNGGRVLATNYLIFERACGAALRRARRYERAYSVPRGLAA